MHFLDDKKKKHQILHVVKLIKEITEVTTVWLGYGGLLMPPNYTEKLIPCSRILWHQPVESPSLEEPVAFPPAVPLIIATTRVLLRHSSHRALVQY